MFNVTKTYQLEIVARDSSAHALSHTAALEAVLNVVDDPHPRKHTVLLKHDSTFWIRSGNGRVGDQDRAIRWK
jgi:hypothetical protein